MNEHQLKLSKIYAELIGVNTHMLDGFLISGDNFNEAVNQTRSGILNDSECLRVLKPMEFNPFIGQLQLDARDNFDVQKVNSKVTKNGIIISIEGGWCITVFDKALVSEKTIECILKSKGLM